MMRYAMVVAMAAAVLAAPGVSSAQDYAIASLVGNQISYAYAHTSVGTRLQQEFPVQPVAEPVFNEAAMQAIAGVLRRTDAQRKIVWLSISDPALVEMAKLAPSPGSAEFTAIIDPIAAAALASGANRLIVVLPFRLDIMVPTDQGNWGTGKAAGLGVYLNPTTRTRDSRSPGVGYGFLALFANFQIVVLDTASGRVLSSDAVAKGGGYSSAGAPGADPFHAVSPKEKIAGIITLVRRGIEERLPTLLERASQ
jgi:hypothetical protein